MIELGATSNTLKVLKTLLSSYYLIRKPLVFLWDLSNNQWANSAYISRNLQTYAVKGKMFLKCGKVFENYQWKSSFFSKFSYYKVVRGFSQRFQKTIKIIRDLQSR